MKPTHESGNAPAIQPNSLTPVEPFKMLLARYKARVHERYGNEVGRMGTIRSLTRPLPVDGKKQTTYK